ncbi:MAG TPA: hypothetical protein VJ840_11635 [Gemmatimonadaceae bacterium]|nr:hypothetical protein [Gemmatimonadaceae bacterium]
MEVAPRPSRYRTVIGAASLIIGPALMSVGDLLHPHESWDAAAQVAMIAESASRWYVAHLLLFIGMLLLVPGILALTEVVAERRPAIGYAARLLLLASVGALSAVFVCEMLLGRFVYQGSGEAAAVRLFETFQSGAVLGALIPGLLAFFVGTALFVTPLASRTSPFRWPALCFALGALLILGEIILAEVILSQIGNILIFGAGVLLARLLLRMSGERSQLAQH